MTLQYVGYILFRDLFYNTLYEMNMLSTAYVHAQRQTGRETGHHRIRINNKHSEKEVKIKIYTFIDDQ